MNNEVFVTGIGIISALGADIDSTWKALLNGENGIKHIREFDPTLLQYGINLIAHTVDFDLNQCNIKKSLIRHMSFTSQMLVYSGLHALSNAGIDYTEETKILKIGSIIGAGNSLAYKYNNEPFEQRSPTWFLDTYPNLHLSFLCLAANLNGFGSTIVSACSSSTQAIGQAYTLIKQGQFDIMLAGGVEDKFDAPFLSGFSRLNMASKSNDPDTAMRPFDNKRDGFVIGQGACVLVLESAEHVNKRKIEPLARICGYGNAMGLASITDADSKGIEKAIRLAMHDAQITGKDIDYINLHGSSTVSNDKEETIAVKNIFKDKAYEIPINSTKSMLGHSFAACGAIESAVCIKSIQDQKIHLTRNFNKGDEICDLDYVKGSSRDAAIKYCINSTSGIGGYNAALILGKM